MNLLRHAQRNATWFRRSGVMLPSSGEWGVAERIAVLKDNAAARQIQEAFPACTVHGDYAVVEQRRSDCNFETALFFALLADVTGSEEDIATAQNILDFLYFRSGLLNRFDPANIIGSWNWSHIKWSRTLWFDDEGWDAAIALLLAQLRPEWNRRYECEKFALALARELRNGFERAFRPRRKQAWEDPEKIYLGDLRLPHWAVPPLCAILAADRIAPDPANRQTLKRYFTSIETRFNTFNSSELSYVLILAPLAVQAYGEDVFRRVMNRTAKTLLNKQRNNPFGNLPAEHFEAPQGAHLADTIYTLNWAFLGFLNLAEATGKKEHRDAADRLAELLCSIQDPGPEPQYAGCWRGMYDLESKCWGGGDRYEGGAGSIYTGWTNAPIALGLLLAERRIGMRGLFGASGRV